MSLYEKLIAKEAVLAVVGLGYVGMVLAVVGLGYVGMLLRWHLQRRA